MEVGPHGSVPVLNLLAGEPWDVTGDSDPCLRPCPSAVFLSASSTGRGSRIQSRTF